MHMLLRSSVVGLLAFSMTGGSSPQRHQVPAPSPHVGQELDLSHTSGWIENLGQWQTEAVLVSTSPGVLAWAEPWAIVLAQVSGGSKPAAPVRLVFEGARPGILPEGQDVLPGEYNYFQGNDPERWTAGVRSYRSVRYRDLYHGIDLVLHEFGGQLKYDVIVAPGADLSQFVVRCSGVDSLEVDAQGDLVLSTPLGALRQSVGSTWQVKSNGDREPLKARYRLLGSDRFGLEVPGRDPALSLVVDPELAWATYLGSTGTGTGDIAYAVDVESNGNVTVVGRGDSVNFPATEGTFQSPGAIFGDDAFVTRFDGRDGTLIYSSIIGGLGGERAYDVAVDSAGRATVVGWTNAIDFPTTPGAFDTTKEAPNSSAFVLRLSPNGDALEYSTFLEGTTNGATAFGVGVLDSGQALVGGEAYSSDFPTTPGAFQTSQSPLSSVAGFVVRLSPSGSSLEWSSFLGGVGVDRIFDLAVDESGQATVVGSTTSPAFPTTPGAYKTGFPTGGDAFVCRFSADGDSLVWSTLLGGTLVEDAFSVALGRAGSVVVGGITKSTDFPTTAGAFQGSLTPPLTSGDRDGFVAHVDASGSNLIFSTYLGGTGIEIVLGTAVDASGVVTVAGINLSSSFPTTPGAFAPIGAGSDEGFITRLDPKGTRLFYSTYIGGPSKDGANDIAVSAAGRVTMAGYSFLGGFPTTPGSFSPNYNGGQRDGVVASLDLLLQGVRLAHHSKRSCLGPIALNAIEMPVSGTASFGFYCSGAPPLANGWLITDGGNLDAVSVSPSGRLLLSMPKSAQVIPVIANQEGYVETPFSLAGCAAGSEFKCRMLFNNTAACGGLGTWSASNSLIITVQ